MFDRKTYFDEVRRSLFGGSLTQHQVDGQDFLLSRWELHPLSDDLRWLAYPLATTKHETASTMWPIEEFGHGKGKAYGKTDPETGQVYFGRGFVQITWRANYRKATKELDLSGDNDLEWHAERALDPTIAAAIMYLGMVEGWFRKSKDGKPQTLERYFSATTDDAYSAREIINGDKHIVPKWSDGASIGNLIAGYHGKFLGALELAWREPVEPEPEPEVPDADRLVIVNIQAPPGVEVVVHINGQECKT